MKRLAAILLLTVCLPAALAAAAIVWRVPIAEAAIVYWLGESGIDRPELTISRFGAEGLVIERLRGGPDGGLRVDRLDIAYTPATLMRGWVQAVELRGAHVPLAWEDGGLRLVGTRTGPTTGSAPVAPVLPAEFVRITDVVIRVTTPAGVATLAADGTLRQSPADGVTGEIAFALEHGAASASGTASASGPSLSTLAISVIVADGAAEFGEASLTGIEGRANVDIRDGTPVGAEAALAAGDARLAGPGGPIRGEARLDFDWEPPRARLDGTLREAGGEAGYRIEVEASEISQSAGALTGIATLQASADRLSLETFSARGLRLSVPIRFAREGEGGSTLLALTGSGSLGVETAALDDAARLTAPLAVSLDPADTPLLSLEPDGGLAYAVSLGAETLAIEVSSDGTPTIPAVAQTVRLDLSGERRSTRPDSLRGAASAGEIALPDQAVALERVDADFALQGAPAGLTAATSVRSLVHRGEPAWFAPLAVEGRVSGPLDALRFDAAVRDEAGTVRALVEGTWPPTRDEAILATIGPFDFEPGGLQPADLSPRAGALEDVRGSATASVRVERGENGLATSGAADLDTLSFTLAGTRIDGLTTSVRFTDLRVPTTAPGQVLTIARVDLPTAIEALRAVYELEAGPSGNPILRIATARGDLLGGAAKLTDVALDLGAASQAVPFELDEIDLESLFALADIDGIRGTGTLSGRLPVRISGSSVAIEDGRLASAGGVLHVRSDTAAELLAAQGESVDMALRALEDFRYSELSIEVDKPLDGRARLALSMLGHNPAVLDGHPFRFNVTLTSNVDELVAALLRGYRVATDALERGARRP